MFTTLNQNYPTPNAGVRSLISAILFGLFISLFLLFFEPFGINLSTNQNKSLTLLFFGLITTTVLFIFLYLLPLLLPRIFSDKHWKVKHQILFYLTILFVIATLNGIYTNYINSLKFSWSNYWWIINRTFVLGGIPISFLTIIDYYRKINLNFKEAKYILDHKKELNQIPTSTIWEISTDLKNEILQFDEDKFIYAKAIGNYTDLYIIENDVLKKSTYRITLSSFEGQLNSISLVRCHRSYLVNLKKVKDISGNAQGLKLKLTTHSDIVPVSRKHLPTIKKCFLEVT